MKSKKSIKKPKKSKGNITQRDLTPKEQDKILKEAYPEFYEDLK